MADEKILTHALIAHATNDEDEDTTQTDGDAGDQNGYETNACKWYDYPWIAVYRSNDPLKAEGMAHFMERAVTNGYFGYNQNRNRRRDFFRAVEAADFMPEHVNENVGADCSALTYAAVYSQYRIEAPDYKMSNGDSLHNIPKTVHFDDYLMNVVGDFVKYTDADHLKSAASLMRGDILLASGHCAVWI